MMTHGRSEGIAIRMAALIVEGDLKLSLPLKYLRKFERELVSLIANEEEGTVNLSFKNPGSGEQSINRNLVRLALTPE